MKKIIYLIALCLPSVLAQAQSLFVPQPSVRQVKLKSRSDQKKINREIDELKYARKRMEDSKNERFKVLDSLKSNGVALEEISANNRILDTLTRSIEELSIRINTIDTVTATALELLNKMMPRLTISGIGGISLVILASAGGMVHRTGRGVFAEPL
jgi:biopolymer transport protein ExbB/TolQ